MKASIHAHGPSELKGRPAVMRQVARELKALAQRLRAVRERAGLTQEQAAERIGLHAKHLQRLERGGANVTLATLVACAHAYGTELASLLRTDEAPEPFTRRAEPSAGAVPLYSLEAAAGAFGRFELVRPEAWVETRGRTRAAPGLFVARVVGESMNRRIPSGSFCLFRAPPAEPLDGKVVLAQHRRIEDPDHGGQYTVKVYARAGRAVRLEPRSTSRRYRAMVLGSGEGLSIVAELVEVLR